MVDFIRPLQALPVLHQGHPPRRLAGHRRVSTWAGQTEFSLCNSLCGVDSEVTVPDLYNRPGSAVTLRHSEMFAWQEHFRCTGMCIRRAVRMCPCLQAKHNTARGPTQGLSHSRPAVNAQRCMLAAGVGISSAQLSSPPPSLHTSMHRYKSTDTYAFPHHHLTATHACRPTQTRRVHSTTHTRTQALRIEAHNKNALLQAAALAVADLDQDNLKYPEP
jgi:hypothetical protein